MLVIVVERFRWNNNKIAFAMVCVLGCVSYVGFKKNISHLIFMSGVETNKYEHLRSRYCFILANLRNFPLNLILLFFFSSNNVNWLEAISQICREKNSKRDGSTHEVPSVFWFNIIVLLCTGQHLYG